MKRLLRHAQGREVAVIPVVSLLFATMGALENMGEEIIALVLVLLVLMRRLGYPALPAVAVSLGTALVGAAFSPINPFRVGIAQQLALLPLLSAEGFVMGFRDIAFSAILVGFARAIFVVLEQGHVADTIVQGLATPLAHLPVAAALGMQAALHLPVPSVSVQAVLLGIWLKLG